MCAAYDYICEYAQDGTSSTESASGVASKPEMPSTLPNGNGRLPVVNSPSLYRNLTGGSPDSPAPTHEDGMLFAQRFRFVSASSVIAFPRVLELELGSKNPLNLHSFGYNMGVGAEEHPSTLGHLMSLVTEAELSRYSDVFFSSLEPVLELLDEGSFRQKCRLYYHEKPSSDAFSAVIAGVVLLGSLMSYQKGHPREADIAQFARNILNSPTYQIAPCVDLAISWTLRTLYLRSTTRPMDGWLASHTCMHVLETIGLHREQNIAKIAAVVDQSEERLRWIFWVSWSFHVLISYEYGRSFVVLPSVTCQNVTARTGSCAHQIVHLAQIIPTPNSPLAIGTLTEATEKDFFVEKIKAVDEIVPTHPIVALIKADVILCFYRRLYQQRAGVKSEIAQLIIETGNDAVDAANQLATELRPFWSALGAVFQYACTLMALNTADSLSNLAPVLQCLRNLVSVFDSELTRQALSIAERLVGEFTDEKRRELALMDAVEISKQPHGGAGNLNPTNPPNFFLNDLDMDLLLDNIDWYTHPGA